MSSTSYSISRDTLFTPDPTNPIKIVNVHGLTGDVFKIKYNPMTITLKKLKNLVFKKVKKKINIIVPKYGILTSEHNLDIIGDDIYYIYDVSFFTRSRGKKSYSSIQHSRSPESDNGVMSLSELHGGKRRTMKYRRNRRMSRKNI